MAIIIKIFFVLTTLHVGDAREWKPEVYAEGDNVTVRIDDLQINWDEVSEINFSGFFSKITISNVLMYDPMKMHFNPQSVTINYIDRIRNIKIEKGCFSFLLLRVNWMDSGNYTVFQNFLEKGKTSILVPRRVLVRKDVGPVILPFMCNKANMSSIKIEMINPISLAVVIYDVEQKHCTQIEDLYLNRIESCVLNASNFTFTLQNVSWFDKGTYVAWDDKRFLLDSINLDIQDLKLTTHTQPANANVYIDSRQTEGNRRLEIDLSGYSVKLHLTNMMLSDPKNDQHDGGSVSSNAIGQIQVILKDKSSLSFQLLNASFEGMNEFEKSCEKGNAIINVTRSRLVQQGEESGKPPCMYNETDISSNTNNKIQTSLAISYNGTQGIPKDVAQSYGARIRNCIFSGNNVSFIFQESSWLENATFTACDEKGFILQSIYIDVQSSKEYHKLSTGPSSTHGSSNSNGSSNENSEWLWIPTVFIVVVAMCLAIFAYRLLRHRRANEVPTSETNYVTYKNRRKRTANGSRDLFMNGNDADTSEKSRMFSAKNQSSENLIDVTNSKDQAKIRAKHVNRLPKSIESIEEPYFDYNYVVQHSFMTLRPPAPDPVAITKSKEEVPMAESISWYKKTKERSSSTLHLPTVYANANKKRSRSSHCIISNPEIGCRNVINELASPGCFDLDYIHATSIMISSCCLSHCGGRNKANAENMDSNGLATRPKFTDLSAYSDIQRGAPLFNSDSPRSNVDHPHATGREHRRSQSLGAMMNISSVRWARRKSARPYIKHKCYDSL